VSRVQVVQNNSKYFKNSMETKENELSEAYLQLAGVLKTLENKHFEKDIDFGINTLACSAWFFSPPAVTFLEKVADPHWLKIKDSKFFLYEFEVWQGCKNVGVNLTVPS